MPTDPNVLNAITAGTEVLAVVALFLIGGSSRVG